MEKLIEILTADGYSRTDLPISKPLVIHAVAGAGKTETIRRFLKVWPATNAQTLGTPDKPNISRKMIRAFTGPKANMFNILDEYCAVPLKGSWDAVFADPLQHPDHALDPHFTKSVSHRVGPETCDILSDIGIEVTSVGESQTVSRTGVFDGELHGVLIALDLEIERLVRNHGLPVLCPRSTIGLQFPKVTVLSSIPLTHIEDVTSVYIALTRHTKELHVRAPPDPDTTC
ncbi:triple gene block protein 1 [Papaya virus X]|uniref:Triple gene block protein 1 n=1 Tax=Papaya virus X TaxID=2717302 RepID=A0A858GIY8_9VIRU|nr:triple gene block protein 1 [Papaya virus X]